MSEHMVNVKTVVIKILCGIQTELKNFRGRLMFKQVSIFLWLVVFLISSGRGQDLLPARTDIVYEISADSLSLNNVPQDLNLSITCGSSDVINAYILRLDETAVLWTIVSAELNNQPLWLIMNENNSERSDILAWQYDPLEKVLRFYPPKISTNYDIKIALRICLLQAGHIQKKSSKEVALEALTTNGIARCTTKGPGNRVVFK